MLYLAIPAQNEVATIGVLLWRLRTVLAEFPREYEVVVYDDASTDETADVAEQYAHAMPVTVLRGAKPVGYAGAVDALVRYVSGHTRYPRRDAMLLLQGDFTDPPGIVPEFARRFEGGADVVVGERTAVVDAPVPVKRLFTAAGWALKPFVRVDGVSDLTGSMRLVRISVLREALRVAGDSPLCAGDSWTANADLLLRLVPHARRVESVPMEPTYGVRMRETRRITVRDALATLRWGWRARGRRAAPTTTPEATTDPATRQPRGAASNGRRRDEPEMTAERLRERKKDRDRPRTDSSLEDAAELARRDKGRRDRREARADAPPRDATQDATPPTASAPPKDTRGSADSATGSPARIPRPPQEERKGDTDRDAKREPLRESPRESRRERAAEPRRPRQPDRTPIDVDAPLDDPFAPPARRQAAPPPAALPEAIPESSPYADDPAATMAVPEPRDAPSDASEHALEGARDYDQYDQDGSDATGNEVAGEESAAARERKRRRNRRSRRRKSRAAGEDAAAGSDDAGESENSATREAERGIGIEADDTTARQPAQRNQSKAGADAAALGGHSRDRDETADESGDQRSDESSEDGGEDGGDVQSAQARAKRRGRRGRRGGARRSRNRGREDGAAGGSDDPGPSDDGPAGNQAGNSVED